MADKKSNDIEELKIETAAEVGYHPIEGYQGGMLAKDAGHLGGPLGGNMVRKMVEAYAQDKKKD